MTTLEMKRKIALAVCPELQDEIKDLKRQLIIEKRRNEDLNDVIGNIAKVRDFYKQLLLDR